MQIGDGGTANNQYLPGYNYYNYSYTQQIYTADEIGDAGTITSIAFKNTGTEKTRTYSIYMALTDIDSFADGNSWVPMSASNLVFAGELTFTVDEWTTIDLDTPFEYNGKSNLLVAVADNTGSYSSSPHMSCLVFSATNQAIRAYRDGSAYNITNPGVEGTVMAVKNQIILNIGDAPTCPKPTGLTVSDITNEGATLTWDAVEGTSYNLNILSESGEETITGITSPYTFTGLESGTNYVVKVQTACSASDVSDWSASMSFTTQLCSEENQCLITYSLADSYGDGWNGANISVVDNETGMVIATLTLTSGQSSEGSFSVCTGREISFVWSPGSYPNECSFVILDINEDEILNVAAGNAPTSSGVLTTITTDCATATCAKPKNLAADEVTAFSATLSWTPGAEDQSAWEIVYSTEEDFDPDTATPVTANSNPFELTGLEAETTYYAYVRAVCSSDDHSNWSNMVTFTTDELCRRPSNVTVSDITANSATVTWEGYADNYEVRYAKVPEGSISKWLQYDDDTYVAGIGNSSATTWTWGVMYPGSMVTADKLKKVAIYEAGYNTEPITINIYSGGDSAPGTLLYTETVTPLANNAMHEITLSTPVNVTPGENVWITLTEYGTYVLSYCASDEPNNNWVKDGDSWYHVSDLSSSLAGDGWMIRGYIDDLDPSTLTWTTDESTTESYNVEELDPETSYIFQVRAKCDEETFSKWVETSFTTSESSAAPEINVTDVTATAATVDWTDSGIDPTSWDVRYKPTVSFETGELPEGWTTIDADGDGYNWEVTETGDRSNSGNYSVSSASYVNNVGAVEPDNWLISPEVTLGGSISFWAAGQDPSWAAEHFAVYVSTTDNTDLAAFVRVAPETEGEDYVASGNYKKYSVDLSQFNGKGYVAIRHYNITDMFRLNIDDISIVEPDKQEWTELNGQTSHPVALEELTPATGYEVQVRTHFNSGNASEWSSACFATGILLELADDGTDNSTLLADYNEKEVVVILTGRTLYRDTKWNTICLPFDVALEGSVLEGAIVKPLSDVTVTDKHVSLTFGDAVDEIEAGVPYIIKWEEAGEDIVDPTFVGVTINDAKPEAQDFADGTVSFVGYYDAFDITPEENSDIWYMKADNTLTHTAKPRTLKAFRTYFVLSEELSSGVNSFTIDFGDGETSTGITEIADSSAPEGYYNLQGVKFDKAPKQKGVYIVNGKKVVVK